MNDKGAYTGQVPMPDAEGLDDNSNDRDKKRSQ